MAIVMKKIKDIKNVEMDYIREDYNQEYLDTLGHAFDAGETLPEIVIDENGKLIEGHHTFRVLERKGKEETLCKVVPVAKDSLEDALRATAYHVKTKLPLLDADYIRTFRNLLKDGHNPKDITKSYLAKRFLSSGRIRNYLMTASGQLYNIKMVPAINMFKAGKSLPEIATKLDISIEFLKKKISEIEIVREKQNKKKLITPVKHFRFMTRRRFKKVRAGLDRDLRMLKEKWQTGFATTDDYKTALQDIKDNIQRLLDMLEEKMSRFNKEIKI
jgi:hypothetical protein